MQPDLPQPSPAGALARAGTLAHHNLLLIARDPGQLINYTVRGAMLMALLQPLYTAALHGHGQEAAQGIVQAAPGMAVMSSLFAMNVIGHDLLNEQSWHTWDRLRATRASTLELLAGKALPLFGLLALQQTVLFAFATLALGLRPAGPAWALTPIGAAWSLCTLACGAALALGAGSRAQFDALADLSATIATCLGGALIPLALLPDWLRPAAWLSPGYWAMSGYRAALTGAPATHLLRPCAVLLASTAVATALAVAGAARGHRRHL